MAMITFTTARRRARLLHRHHLAVEAPAADTLTATRGVLVLHATDPATVALSVLARVPGSTVPDVLRALNTERSVLRLMAMRRTLFVVDRADAPLLQAAAALGVAATMWKGLHKDVAAGPLDPPLPKGIDPATWLQEVAESALGTLQRSGPLTGSEIAELEPRLRTKITDGTYSQALTSRVLVALAADGRMVRGEPQGGWTSRRHRWEPVETWWPDGLPALDPAAAKAELVRRYLERFGPVTVNDVKWWTGWTLGDTRKALAALDLAEVALDGGTGLVVAGDEAPEPGSSAVAKLLPALDPTPMGWKDRDWLFDVDRTELYDRNGNIGPTIWWNGGVVGGWAVRADGSLATRLLVDIGIDGTDAVAAAVTDLQTRLAGATVIPSFRTPLEKALATS